MKTVTLHDITGPHQDITMAYIPAINQAKAMLILLHGRGATALSMLELSSYFDISDHMIVTAPEASQLAWYPDSIESSRENNRTHIISSLESIEACVKFGKKQGIQPDSMVIVGFSQGACITTEYLLATNHKVGGAAILSGGALGTDKELTSRHDTSPRLKDVLVYIGSDKNDSYINMDRLKKTKDMLEDLHATVQLDTFKDLGHGVNQAELDAVQRLLTNTNHQIN